MSKYKLTWTLCIGYEGIVHAEDKAGAALEWESGAEGSVDFIGKTGFEMVEENSLEIEEIPEDSQEDKIVRLEKEVERLRNLLGDV